MLYVLLLVFVCALTCLAHKLNFSLEDWELWLIWGLCMAMYALGCFNGAGLI
jgi:hypothetical protein